MICDSDNKKTTIKFSEKNFTQNTCRRKILFLFVNKNITKIENQYDERDMRGKFCVEMLENDGKMLCFENANVNTNMCTVLAWIFKEILVYDAIISNQKFTLNFFSSFWRMFPIQP